MRIISLGVALACLAAPLTPLAAQHDDHGRAGLGIFLGNQDGDDSARVRGIVPEGPADKAGLAKGDVILRFNGTSIDGTQKLIELAHRLQPGDTVKLEYRRDGQTRTASVVADRIRPRFAMTFRKMPGGSLQFPGGPDMLFLHSRHEAGLALVPMSRDLGEYFGTSEGMLVVKAPADSSSPLKAGDVILAIDGRKPQSVEHAHRILGSYAAGEKAKLDVMRKRQRTTLTWTAPDRKAFHERHMSPGHGMGMEPDDDEFDSGAMEFEMPRIQMPDMDFMFSTPAESQET